MSSRARPPRSLQSRVWLTLAALAVVMKILVPQGFMAARTNETGFPLVLCTAQGSVLVQPGEPIAPHDDKTPGQGQHDSPCVFAGHGAAAAPPLSVEIGPAVLAVYAEVRPQPQIGLQPGRGLTGPPLPARGPPALLS